MKSTERLALAGTTVVTLLATVAFGWVVAAAPAGHAGDLQTITLYAGPWPQSAHPQGTQQ